MTRIESLTPQQREGFHVVMFGRMPMDLAGVLGLRLSEHAVHAWDVAVTLDPAAKVAPDAVDHARRPVADARPASWGSGTRGRRGRRHHRRPVATRLHARHRRGHACAAGEDDATAAALALPAEALLCLVYGRLDDEQDLQASGVTLTELKSVFPGF